MALYEGTGCLNATACSRDMRPTSSIIVSIEQYTRVQVKYDRKETRFLRKFAVFSMEMFAKTPPKWYQREVCRRHVTSQVRNSSFLLIEGR